MSFLSIGEQVANAQEEHAVAGGEYQVRISYADIPEGKNYMIVRMEVTSDPYAKEVSLFLNLPGSGRTPREENRNLNRLKDFFSCFDLDPTATYEPSREHPEGFINCEGYVFLSDPEDDGKGYGMQNRLKSFVRRR